MWRDIFPKVMKWYVSAFCTIWGIAFLKLVNEGMIEALILAMFCFGMVYWQYKSRSEFPKPVLIATVITAALTVTCTMYIGIDAFPFNLGFFPALSGWAFVIGVPAATWAYIKAD